MPFVFMHRHHYLVGHHHHFIDHHHHKHLDLSWVWKGSDLWFWISRFEEICCHSNHCGYHNLIINVLRSDRARREFVYYCGEIGLCTPCTRAQFAHWVYIWLPDTASSQMWGFSKTAASWTVGRGQRTPRTWTGSNLSRIILVVTLTQT